MTTKSTEWLDEILARAVAGEVTNEQIWRYGTPEKVREAQMSVSDFQEAKAAILAHIKQLIVEGRANELKSLHREIFSDAGSLPVYLIDSLINKRLKELEQK